MRIGKWTYFELEQVVTYREQQLPSLRETQPIHKLMCASGMFQTSNQPTDSHTKEVYHPADLTFMKPRTANHK